MHYQMVKSAECEPLRTQKQAGQLRNRTRIDAEPTTKQTVALASVGNERLTEN